jgi:hypothetical protein
MGFSFLSKHMEKGGVGGEKRYGYFKVAKGKILIII